MRMILRGVAIGLLGGLAACSNYNQKGSPGPQAAAMTAPTAPAMSAAPVSPNMVKQVQSKLQDDGFYKHGAVDGVWGPKTAAAVRSYQHSKNLTTNGELDVPTLQAMNLTSVAQASNAPPTQPVSNNQNSAPVGTAPTQ